MFQVDEVTDLLVIWLLLQFFCPILVY